MIVDNSVIDNIWYVRLDRYDHYFRPSVELTNRINDAEKPICQTMEMKVVPKSAMNLQSKEVLIANVEGKKQIVTHELCVWVSCFLRLI